MLLFLSSLAFAETQPSLTPDLEIEVVASKDIEVFVAPIKVQNLSTNQSIEAVIDKDSAFAYTGTYAPHNVKTQNARGIYEPLSLVDTEMLVYNERTIKYFWPDCNYRRDAMKCTMQNSQYYMETIVTVDDNQLVIRSTLYDPYAQVVSSSTRTDDKIIRWIRQQERTVIQQNGLMGSQTLIHEPKEDLPLRWEIPHMLMDKMVRQCVMGLWTGIKID